MLFVIHNRKILSVTKDTLDHFNLRNGQDINTDTFWKVLGFNSLQMRERIVEKLKHNPPEPKQSNK